MLTNPISGLRTLLREKPALIVHFSGCPKGTEHSTAYPDDLRFAMTNLQEILSCSTVEPADYGARPQRAIGSVGIVLDPINEKSIIYACEEDGGAPKTTAERRRLDRPTTTKDCLRSFDRKGSTPYNEWLVGPFRVAGLYVAPEAQVQLADGDYMDVTPDDMLKHLQHPLVISTQAGRFVKRASDGSWDTLDVIDVYPEV